ncbi:MAG: hypothetical protein LBR53_09575 [Deltaproteobacteria bacterium]|nr:hypothetical protein [Deltaproteobacteria bacterium]
MEISKSSIIGRHKEAARSPRTREPVATKAALTFSPRMNFPVWWNQAAA